MEIKLNHSAKSQFSKEGYYLARGLSQVINIIDQGAIVLGGGVSNMKQIFLN